MTILVDFKSDFRAFCHKILLLYGIQGLDAADKGIEMLFWKTLYRIPPPIKRNIQKSRNFICPVELQEGLQNLEKRIQEGESLYPFLSRRIKYTPTDQRFLDDLLSDWGIHHFHLGKDICDNFADRTGNLLYAIVTTENFYEIAIMPHGQWNNQQLLESVFENWSFLLKPYILSNISITSNPSIETLRKLRGAHIMTPIQLRSGICLCSPGGGYATDGTPSKVVGNYDRMAMIIMRLEEEVKSNKVDNINKISQSKSYRKLVVHLDFSLHKLFEPDIRAEWYE